jgi:hypothetical protein
VVMLFVYLVEEEAVGVSLGGDETTQVAEELRKKIDRRIFAVDDGYEL